MANYFPSPVRSPFKQGVSKAPGGLYPYGEPRLPDPAFNALSVSGPIAKGMGVGTGSITEARTAIMNTFTHEGRTFEYQGGEVAWEGGRPVRNKLFRSDAVFPTHYASTGGTPAPSDGGNVFSAQGFSNSVKFTTPVTSIAWAYPGTGNQETVPVNRDYIFSFLIKRADEAEPAVYPVDSTTASETDCDIRYRNGLLLENTVSGWYKENLGGGVWQYYIAFNSAIGTNDANMGIAKNTTARQDSDVYVQYLQIEDVTHRKDKITPSEYVPTAGAAVTRTFTSERSTYLPKNLFLYSEQFDNAYWTKTNTTVNATNITDPEGGSTAEEILETAVTDQHRVFSGAQSVTAGNAYTLSIYLKAAGRDYATIGIWSLTLPLWVVYMKVNLTTGAITDGPSNTGGGGTGAHNETGSVTSIGNGWYRCSVTAVIPTGTVSVRSYVSFGIDDTGFDSYLGDITKGIYFWGAQLENESAGRIDNTTPSPYIKTTTAAAAASQVYDRDAATLDVWAVSAPAATNTHPWGSYLTNWTTVSTATVTFDQVGLTGAENSASKVIPTSALSDYRQSNINGTMAVDTMQSAIFYIKKQTGDKAHLCDLAAVLYGGTATDNLTYSLHTGTGEFTKLIDTAESSAATLLDLGDWWGVVLSLENDVADPQTGMAFRVDPTTATGNLSDFVIVTGVQYLIDTPHAIAVGLAKFPIFTSGSAVTRDACVIKANLANHDDSQGVWYTEIMTPVDSSDQLVMVLGPSNTSNDIIYKNTTAFRTYDGTTAFSPSNATFDAWTAVKVSISYGASDGLATLKSNYDTGAEGSYDGSYPNAEGALTFVRQRSGFMFVTYIRNIRRYDVDYETGKQLLLELTTS